MKYAFMSFSCPQLSLRDALALADTLGYSGFEPRVDSRHAHGIELGMTPEARREALAVAGDSPVKLCCLATSARFAGKAALPDTMDYARRAIDVAVALGIPAIRVFGGPIDEGCTRGEAIDQVSQALDTLSGEIGDEDVTLCLETHDSWCEPEHVEAVMRRCRGRHIGVNWDLMHPLLTAHAGMDDTFGLLRPYIKHVHMHGGTRANNSLTFLPIGTGAIDHRQALGLLLGCGYDGYMSGEWINWDDPDYLPRELKTIKAFEEEVRCTR